MKAIIKKNIKYFSILIIISIFVTVINMFNWYIINITPKINILVKSKLEKVSYEIITNRINTELINENNLKDVLIITKNKEGEILTVDYNLERAYRVNNMINDSIRKSIYDLENGILESSEFMLGKNSMYINVPFFSGSNYTILSVIGPKIPIKISFIGTVITNLKTKITSYGLNNVLNELYVTVEIKELITSPITREENILKYDILIDASMINGRIPSFYNEKLIKESGVLDIPIE